MAIVKNAPLYNTSTQQDFNLDSYLSLYTTADSSNVAENTNTSVFRSDNYSSYGYTLVSSEDLIYDSGLGRITVQTAGDYFIYVSGPVTITGGGAMGKMAIVKNGSTGVAENGKGVRIFDVAEDPEDLATHTILTLAAGDYIEVSVNFDDITSGDTVVGVMEHGWHITMLKLNGDWGTVRYTADADRTSAAASSIDLFDVPANNGTISTASKNMTFVAAEGAFTTVAAGTYMMFSTLMFKAAATSSPPTGAGGFHKFALAGSSIDELSMGWHANADDNKLTEMSLLKEGITVSQTIKARYQSDDQDFTAQNGSCFSVFQIGSWAPSGGSAGVVLGPRLGFGANESNSDDFADATSDSGTNIFHQDNWGGGITTTETTAGAGLIFSPITGRLSLSEPGDYFVSVSVGTISQDTGPAANNAFYVKKNGVTVYESTHRSHEDGDPENLTIALILRSEGGTDYYSFHLNEFDGYVDDGTTLSVFKLNNRIKTDEENQFDRFHRGDFTSDKHNKQNNRHQYKRVIDHIPMKLGVRGPISLRGRRTSNYSSDIPPNVGKGKKD